MNHFDMDRNGIINGIDFLILDELLFPKDNKEENGFLDDDFSSKDSSEGELWQ